jgi:hypothetical protein
VLYAALKPIPTRLRSEEDVTVSTVRPPVQLLVSLVAVLTAFALAQPATTVERPEFDVRFDAPPAWVAEVVDQTANAETVTITAPGEAGVVVVVLARLTADDLAELAGVGPDTVWDAWEGFASGMGGISPQRDGVVTVAGIQAGIIDYVGQGISGSLIGFLGDAVGVTIASIAVEGRADEIRAGLETIVSSFAFRSTAGADAGNPLAPAAANPLASAAANPLAPAPANPLAPAPANPLAPAAADPSAPAVGAAPTRNPLAPPTAQASVVAEPSYREPFTGTDPSSTFGGVLDVGSDGTWTGTLTGSAYRLSNAVDGGAVRYYYLTGLPGEAGPLAQGTIGVTLGLAPGGGGLSAAGLIFDFDPSNGHYLAFALSSTGYVVLQRGSGGLELLVDETLDSLRPDGRNRLELRAFGTSVEVVVNGATAATLNAERPFDGGVGIVAIGAGTFEFQDFHYLRP